MIRFAIALGYLFIMTYSSAFASETQVITMEDWDPSTFRVSSGSPPPNPPSGSETEQEYDDGSKGDANTSKCNGKCCVIM